MQSPEVQNFPAPDSQFCVEKFEGYPSLNNCSINNFHYSHLLTVIIPEESSFEKDFEHNFLDNRIFYKIIELNVQDLAEVNFISSFIQNGKLTLLSINRRIDCDNCIGITPHGKLCLSLDKETYQSLGIEGSPSHFTRKLGNRYIVITDLSDEKLLSTKSKLEKLKSSLRVLNTVTVLVSWQPETEEICPSSVAKFFVDVGYKVRQCTSSFQSRRIETNIPNLDFRNADKFDLIEFIEWLGVVATNCDDQQDRDNYLSSYVPVTDDSKVQVRCVQMQGFFSTADVSQIVKQITKGIARSEKQWLAIYVQGFSDCPVSWRSEEQHYFTNGDNGYVIIINKDGGLICTHKCSKRRYK